MSGQEAPAARKIPIEWHISDSIITRYASNIVVQHTEHEFIVMFFEARPPIILGEPEEKQARLEALSTVRAECVARIVVSASNMPGFIQALQQNFDQFTTQKDAEG